MTRKRKHRFLISLNDEEYEHLNQCVKLSGLTREQYTRMLYKKVVPRPCPSSELLETIVQLRRIGNNINQIAYVANASNNIDSSFFKECFKELQEQILEIKYIMLSPVPLKLSENETKI